MSKQYRIGIIGVGGISTMHANAIGDLPNAQVVAGVCRTEKKGREFAEKFNCKWFSDSVEMMDEVKPDVVCIATPSGAHLDPTKAAAERGIHVLCEKPLEITTERIDEMIEACKANNVMLGGIFPSRFNPVVNLLRDAVAAGRFGQMSVAAAYVPWWRDDAYYSPDRWQGTKELDGGGAMMNQSIHNVDALQWIVGADPTCPAKPGENPVAEIFAFTGKRGHDESLIEVEDTAVAVLRFKNGAFGQLLGATSMFPGTDRRVWVAGREGTAEVIEEQLTVFSFRDEKPEDKKLVEQYANQTKSTGASDPLAISYEGHTHNIGAFLKSLDAGESPTIDGPQARVAVEILRGLYESAATGKLVKF